jgi:hypothetical protein
VGKNGKRRLRGTDRPTQNIGRRSCWVGFLVGERGRKREREKEREREREIERERERERGSEHSTKE